ncbi:hypothetical protein [Streptomyces kanasensis]|uniref:hypothetical protein n=1 Tax=Streptomyces kanasensis TaxID=936756 RepID=UPI0037FFF5CD
MGEERGPLLLVVERPLGQGPVGVVDQPPHDVAVRADGRVSLQGETVVAAPDGAARGAGPGVVVLAMGEAAVRVGEPRRQRVVDPGTGDRLGEERGRGVLRPHHAAGGVGDECGVGRAHPGGAHGLREVAFPESASG